MAGDWRQVRPVVSVRLGGRECIGAASRCTVGSLSTGIKESACGSHVLTCRNSWKSLENKCGKRKAAPPDSVMPSELNRCTVVFLVPKS